MGQSRSSQDAPNAICLQDRVTKKSIWHPPVGWLRRRSDLSSIYLIRMGLRLVQMLGKKLQADDVMQRMPRSDLFFHLLFANSVQMDPDARSPHFHRRQAEIPVITFS